MAQVQVKLKRLIKEEEDDSDDVVSEAVLGTANPSNDLLSEEDIAGRAESSSHAEQPRQSEWVRKLLQPVGASSLDNLDRLFVDCVSE